MAIDLNGSNQAISYTLASAQTSLTTMTIARWVYPDSVGQYKRDFHLGAGYPNWQMLMQMDDGWGWVFGVKRSTSAGTWSIAKPSTGAWLHNVVTYDATSTSNDPIIYNGGVSQTVTERETPSGTLLNTGTAFYIGSEANTGQYWDGRVAEFAMWNRVLSQAEVTALAAGYSPLFFLRGLVFYDPLIRGSKELMFGLTGTLANSPSTIEHPRMIYPSGNRVGIKPTAFNNYTKSLDDSIIVSSNIAKLISKQEASSINTVESLVRSVIVIKNDIVDVAGNIIRSTNTTKSDVINLSEDFSSLKAQFKTLSDSIIASELLLKSITTIKSDSLDVTDDLSIGYAEQLDDTISILDTVSKQANKTLADSVNEVSTIARALTHSLSDIADLSEDFTALRAIFENYDDSINLAETITKSKTQLLSDTIAAIEVFTKYVQKIYTDSVNGSDDIDTELTGIKELSDTIMMSESFSKYLQRSLSDNLIASEVFEAIRLYVRGLSDTLDISEIPDQPIDDFAGYGGASYATMTYGGALFTSQSRNVIFDIAKTHNENMVVSSALSAAVTLGRILTDTIIMSDSVQKLLNGLSLAWTKIAKQGGGIWTKAAKQAADTWTKVTKTSGLWTKQTKYEP